jgi:CrcB protein
MAVEAHKVVLVLLGGALGTGCRYALSSAVYGLVQKPTFPWANLVINVSGSFAIGVLAQLFDQRLVPPATRAALLTGVLGGYTTFSSFAYETLALLRDGEVVLALLNALGSVVLGLAAVWAGMRLVQALW